MNRYKSALVALVVGLATATATSSAHAVDFWESTAFCRSGAAICWDQNSWLFPGVRLSTEFRVSWTKDFGGYFDYSFLDQIRTPALGVEVAVYRNLIGLSIQYLGPLSLTASEGSGLMLRSPDRRLQASLGLATGVTFFGGGLNVGVILIVFDPTSFAAPEPPGSTLAFQFSIQPISFFRSLAGTAPQQ
jgi:hypothetical protein